MIKLPDAIYACYRSDTSILTSSRPASVFPFHFAETCSSLFDPHLSKRGRSMSGEQSLAGGLGHTVRKRKFEVLGEQLFDVRALDIIGLLKLDDFEDLWSQSMSVR